MKIAVVSDMHGILPEMPEADLVLIAGDICPEKLPIYMDHNFYFQRQFLDVDFRDWLSKIKCPVVCTPGNHDVIFEIPHLVPSLPCKILIDDFVEVNGIKIHGCPWQLPYGTYSFMADEETIHRKLKYIRDDTQILLLHSPPFGTGDWVYNYVKTFDGAGYFERINCGSIAVRDKIQSLKNLKLAAFGHIHEGWGVYDINGVVAINASHVRSFRRKEYNKPILVEVNL